MTLKLGTKELSIHNAKVFLDSLSLSDGRNDKNSTVLYCLIGRNEDWTSDPTPNNIINNDQYLQKAIFRHAIGAKKINASSVSHVAPRYNWSSNTVYSMYRDTDWQMYSKQFYVMTDEFNVYKCLFNNNGERSTVKPTGFSTLPFTTSDGYTWKYLFTISLGDSDKFMTTNFIPVKNLTSSDGTTEADRQVLVQNAASNGAIEIIEIRETGSGYKTVSNGVVASAGTTTIRLSTVQGDPSPIDNYYNGASVYITTGTGAGQLRRIVDYVGATKTLTVNTAFATVANTDSRVVISPTITIIGDGSGARAYSRVDTTTGAISNVTVISVGSKYSFANVIITSNNTLGSGATANAIVSPLGGHGSDMIRELGADKLLLNAQFSGSEGISANGNGYIPANTDFRTISIWKDPILKVNSNNNTTSTEAIANNSNSPSTLRLTSRLQISYNQMSGGSPVNPLLSGDVITNERNRLKAELGTLEFVTELNPAARQAAAMTNAVKAANANIVYIREDETVTDPSFYVAYINSVQSYSNYAAFVNDDTILVSDSETKVATVEDIKGPEANTYSGQILFTENVQPVTKDVDQIEDLKIVLDF